MIAEPERPSFTRVSAYGLVMDDGRLLLCRVSGRLPADKGKWTLPGGRIEFGEDPRDAAVREVFEETGLHVRVAGLVEIDSELFFFEDSTMHGIRIIYAVEVVGGDLKNEVEGTTDLCAWFTVQETKTLGLVSLAKRGLKLAFGEAIGS